MTSDEYLAVNNDKADNLYNYVDEKIVPELEKISSVASVDISGGREEYIRVEVIPEKLKQYHLSMNSLVTAVASANLAYPARKHRGGEPESFRYNRR